MSLYSRAHVLVGKEKHTLKSNSLQPHRGMGQTAATRKERSIPLEGSEMASSRQEYVSRVLKDK